MNRAFSASPSGLRWLIRLAYLGVLLLATLARLDPVLDAAAAVGRAGKMLEPGYATALMVDAVRNVLLFAGWGLVWIATAPTDSTPRALWEAVGTGTLISVGVETLQLFSATRRASVLDIAANASGSLLGALALIAAVAWLTRQRRSKSFVGLPAAVFASCYLAAVMGEALLPLFPRGRLPVWGSPSNRLEYALEVWDPLSVSVLPLSDIVLFLPAGFLLTAALVEAGRTYRRSAVVVILLGVLLMAAAEIGHGMLSVPIHTGAFLVHAVGMGAGALLATASLPAATRHVRGVERPRWLLFMYCLILGLWFLRPYTLEPEPAAWIEQLTSDWWKPLAFAAYRMDLYTVVDVTGTFFLYFPLGCLLAVWPLSAERGTSALLPPILLAAALEATQVMIQGRTLAVADVVIAAAAVWAGHTVVRRAALPVRGTILS